MPPRAMVPFLTGIVAAIAHAETAVLASNYLHMPAYFALRQAGWNLPWIIVALTVVDLVVIAVAGAFVIRQYADLSWWRAFALFAAGYFLGYLTYDLVVMGPDPVAAFVRLQSVIAPMLIALVLSALAFRAVLRGRPEAAVR